MVDSTEQAPKSPIAVMSFRRPVMLEAVLRSIAAQKPETLAGREIHLFQDGAVNRYSGIRYATDDSVKACIEAFKAIFPEGVVHDAGDNIGICENFDRTENYFFDERGFDCALFFEDDMVLSPSYLAMMDLMETKCRDMGFVAYFAAYGDYYDPPEPGDELFHKVSELDHHWGFGLFRHARAQIRRHLEPYFSIVYGTDYSRRDHAAIFDLYRSMRSSPEATSQDAAKAHACAQLGYWRCKTNAAFAKYIGSDGQHMTPEAYAELGFGDVKMVSDVIELEWPSGRVIQDFIIEQRNMFYDNFVHRMDDLREKGTKFLSPIRPCTPEDVADIYSLLLGRAPESDDVITAHAGVSSVVALASGVTASQEFCSRMVAVDPDSLEGHIAGRVEIKRLYQLLLHREPESEATIEARSDKYPVANVVKAITSSEEYTTFQASIRK